MSEPAHALSAMTMKKALSYINEQNLAPFSRSERALLAFGNWNSVDTITTLRLPFDPWSLGLCYLVCTATNINFILAKTATGLNDDQPDQHDFLVLAGENEGASWRQLAIVRTLPQADQAICSLYAQFPNHRNEGSDGQG